MKQANTHNLLYNLLGQTVLTHTFVSSNTTLEEIISLEQVNRGLYLLQLEGANGVVWNEKIWLY